MWNFVHISRVVSEMMGVEICHLPLLCLFAYYHMPVRFCFFSVTFCLFLCLLLKCLWNSWTDLRQIHREDVLGPSLRPVWMSRSKVKVTRDKICKTAESCSTRRDQYLRNCWVDLCQIHSEYMFCPSLGQLWCQGQRSKVEVTRDKNALCGLACGVCLVRHLQL